MQAFMREWLPIHLEQAIQERAAHYRALTPAQLEAQVEHLLVQHEQFIQSKTEATHEAKLQVDQRSGKKDRGGL